VSRLEVIVVEDEFSSMKAITHALESKGISFLAINDSKDAMTAAIRHQPQLAILDFMMPDIDGITLCNQLQADSRTNHIDVIFLSAKHNIEDLLIGAKVKYISAHDKASPISEVINRVLFKNFERQCDLSINSFQAAHKEIINQLAH